MARRPCANGDGSAKRRYPTKKLAKHNLQKGQHAYFCDRHPEPCWHVGRTRYVPKGYLDAVQEVTPPPAA